MMPSELRFYSGNVVLEKNARDIVDGVLHQRFHTPEARHHAASVSRSSISHVSNRDSDSIVRLIVQGKIQRTKSRRTSSMHWTDQVKSALESRV